MKRITLFSTACVIAVLALLTSDLRAQSNVSHRTFMTFSGTVELPGVSLEPGTYEFRLADNQLQNVVQVLRKDDSKVIGQWSYVPAERERTTDDTLVMFKETREGSTPAVQYWYYPGEKIGKEFIYPKDQAERIAARTGQSVRSLDGPVSTTAAAATSIPDVTANQSIERDARASASQSDPRLTNGSSATQPSAAAGSLTGSRGVIPQPSDSIARTDADAIAQAEPAPEPRPVGTSGVAEAAPAQERPVPARAAQDRTAQDRTAVSTPAARPAELPSTASPLPLSALIGLTSLVGALGLRFVRG